MKAKMKKQPLKNKRKILSQKAFFSLIILLGIVLLTVNLVGKSQQYRQFAQTSTTNFCSGLVVATSPDFKSQKSLACQFTSQAADKVMQSKAGCTSKAEAEAAIKEACKIANPPANGCVGEVVASAPSFKANKEAACGPGKSQVVDGLVANSDAGCSGKPQAQQAVDAACGGAGGGSSSGGGASAAGGGGAGGAGGAGGGVPSAATLFVPTQGAGGGSSSGGGGGIDPKQIMGMMGGLTGGSGGGGGGGPCFIATAAYGTSMAEDVRYLRVFRDEYLLTNSLGSKFVALYYAVSPPLAQELSKHDGLRAVVRVALVPFVTLSRWTVNTEAVDRYK